MPPVTEEKVQILKEKFLRSGYFFAALFLHIIVFLLVATIIIWKAPEVRNDGEFQQVQMVKIPPPPPSPPSPSGDSARNPQLDPQPVTVPVSTPLSVISTANSSYSVNAEKLMSQTLSHVNLLTPTGAGMTSGGGATGAGAGAGFGSFSGTANDFLGTVYDLKIGPDHRPTGMNQARYTKILTDFVAGGWNEATLAPYYKASKKLYAPAIWIPTTPSERCAKEMNLDNELSSTMWVGWYRARVIAPKSAKYHFVGFGDDILAVAVNGKVVLDGSLWPVTKSPQKMPWPFTEWSRMCGWRGQNYGMYRVGDSFEANPIETITIDVLMGDEPGGFYNAYLLIAEDKRIYPLSPEKVPLYPIFQLGTEEVKRNGDQPPHSTVAEPWAGVP